MAASLSYPAGFGILQCQPLFHLVHKPPFQAYGDKNNMHTQPTVIRSSINRFWFDRKRIYLRNTVTPSKGIWNLGNFSLGIWNKGQVLWIPLIIGIQNPSSTDKESRMQYPWSRIKNPRLSDFLAWADHYFQLDKIKDIMCFHYFIFATRKTN